MSMAQLTVKAYLVSPGISGKHHVLDSDFTLVSLAFLCSRLLSASKRARAATLLQRAWRRILSTRELHRRSVAREIAQQCAAVVRAKDQVLWAQETISRWWRRSKRQQAMRTRRGVEGGGKSGGGGGLWKNNRKPIDYRV